MCQVGSPILYCEFSQPCTAVPTYWQRVHMVCSLHGYAQCSRFLLHAWGRSGCAQWQGPGGELEGSCSISSRTSEAFLGLGSVEGLAAVGRGVLVCMHVGVCMRAGGGQAGPRLDPRLS